MSLRGRVVGAALGLLVFAALFGPTPLRAQSDDPSAFKPPMECSDPPPPPFEDEISVNIVSPTGTEATSSPNVPVEATFTNEDNHDVFGRNGRITVMRSYVIACEAGQHVPTSPDPVHPDVDQRTASMAWSADFTTNGRYAVVFEAEGESPTDERQAARAVQPVTLAVPPKKPTNVQVTDPVDGTVKVSWEYVDPEPDLFGFEIRRARQGTADYTTVANGAVGPTVRSVSDSPPVGAWRYQVIAYRRGAPEGAISREDTVEVPEAAPGAETADTDGGTTGSGSTTGTAGGTGSGSGGSSTTVGGTSSTAGTGSAPRSSVDLSNFAAALNARRNAPAGRIEPPDPGFQETLPFDAPAPLEIEADEPEELGADEPNVGLGQRPVSDPGERQRSLGFVAFGLLLFVLSMTGLFVKSEVKRFDLLDLEVDDPDVDADAEGAPLEADDPRDDLAGAPLAAPVVANAAATRSRRRRERRDRPAASAVASAVVPEQPAPAPTTSAIASEPDPASTAPLALPVPGRRRRLTGARPVEPAEATPTVVEPAVAASGASSRRRRARTPAAAPAEVATTDGSPTIEIPESRRRWSGRVIESVNGHGVDAPPHDFADLAPVAAAAPAPRRRTRAMEAPLDAPGLDVPDPAPAARRPRPGKPTAKSPLPTRRKSTSGTR